METEFRMKYNVKFIKTKISSFDEIIYVIQIISCYCAILLKVYVVDL